MYSDMERSLNSDIERSLNNDKTFNVLGLGNTTSMWRRKTYKLNKKNGNIRMFKIKSSGKQEIKGIITNITDPNPAQNQSLSEKEFKDGKYNELIIHLYKPYSRDKTHIKNIKFYSKDSKNNFIDYYTRLKSRNILNEGNNPSFVFFAYKKFNNGSWLGKKKIYF